MVVYDTEICVIGPWVLYSFTWLTNFNIWFHCSCFCATLFSLALLKLPLVIFEVYGLYRLLKKRNFSLIFFFVVADKKLVPFIIVRCGIIVMYPCIRLRRLRDHVTMCWYIQLHILTMSESHIVAELVSFILLIRLKEVEINRTIYLFCPCGNRMHCTICCVIRHVRLLFGMHSAHSDALLVCSPNVWAIRIISANMNNKNDMLFTNTLHLETYSNQCFDGKKTKPGYVNEERTKIYDDKPKNLIKRLISVL